MRSAGSHQLAEAIVFIAQLAIDQRAVEKLNRHAEVRIARSLAGTDALSLWLPENLQEVMLGQVRRRQLRRLEPSGQAVERLGQAGQRTNRVEQLLGCQQSRLIVRKILHVVLVEFIRPKIGLVCPAIEDLLEQMLAVEFVLDKVLGQRV